MPKDIVELSRKILGDFERVTVKPEQATAEKVEQAVYFVSKGNKVHLLVHMLEEKPDTSVLVFSRTKHGANKIVKKLGQADIRAAAIHGNKSQTARQNALNDFKNGSLRVLIATDIAARGIDVDDLSLVINYDLPNVPETYVHRIGRTGRANASGIAISFCDQEERPYLRDIEKLIKSNVPKILEHPYHEEISEGTPARKQGNQRSKSSGQNGNRNKSRSANYRGKNNRNRRNNNRNRSESRD